MTVLVGVLACSDSSLVLGWELDRAQALRDALVDPLVMGGSDRVMPPAVARLCARLAGLDATMLDLVSACAAILLSPSLASLSTTLAILSTLEHSEPWCCCCLLCVAQEGKTPLERAFAASNMPCAWLLIQRCGFRFARPLRSC
jgi:hypothetical protein